MNHPTPSDGRVAVVRGTAAYPADAPYHPDTRFPELAALGAAVGPADSNPAYRMVREALVHLGGGIGAPGDPAWNPLAAWIRPGDRVLLKPNWVMDWHPNEAMLGEQLALDSLVTHPAVLRAVLDYAQLALGGRGQLTIADAPLQACDLPRLQQRTHIAALTEHFAALARAGMPVVPVTTEDLRLEIAAASSLPGGIGQVYRKVRRDDEGRHLFVQVGEASQLEPIAADWQRFRVTCYDPSAMGEAHRPGHHMYCIGRAVLEADCVIDLPKFKTHKKSGITVALKNLIGINGHKSYLPHHRRGSIASGGDEFLAADPLKEAGAALQDRQHTDGQAPWLQRAAALGASGLAAVNRALRQDGTESGSWYGNDTIWRTCIDLNRVLLYADAQGQFPRAADAQPCRRVLHIVDGIIGGDCDGPLNPRPQLAGVVLAGGHAAFVDIAAALVMGLDWRAIPIVAGAFAPGEGPALCRLPPEALELVGNVSSWCGAGAAVLDGLPGALDFQPATGWEGAVDRGAYRTPRLPADASVRPMGALWRSDDLDRLIGPR